MSASHARKVKHLRPHPAQAPATRDFPKPQRRIDATPSASIAISVSILAGGLSTRMGRDKSRARLGKKSLLQHARALAAQLNRPIRVIRRDCVPRCGPLGGIFTALTTSNADAELFLACDMPFVTPRLLRRIIAATLKGRRAVFTTIDGVDGFPFVIRVHCLPIIRRQLNARRLSLQSLANALSASRVTVTKTDKMATTNINTPADLKAARLRPMLSGRKTK